MAAENIVVSGPNAHRPQHPQAQLPMLPGWKYDSEDPTLERFWNGHAWTELTRPALTLDDFLGPIEPLLLQILEDSTDLEDSADLPDSTDLEDSTDLLDSAGAKRPAGQVEDDHIDEIWCQFYASSEFG